MSDDTPAAVDRGLPRPEDVLAEVKASPTPPMAAESQYLDRFRKTSIEAQESYAHLQGLRDHYQHKKNWSWFIMLLMAGMVGFQSYLLYRVGVGAWDFKSYEWLLPALLVQNLTQIVGLAVFVVKALFKDIRS